MFNNYSQINGRRFMVFLFNNYLDKEDRLGYDSISFKQMRNG